MSPNLDNPVFSSLSLNDYHLGSGTEKARYFDENVSPFAGFETGYDKGFDDLYDLLPAERKILYATRGNLTAPGKWQILHEITGLQFVFNGDASKYDGAAAVQPLEDHHIPQMVALANLTKPGPFNTRTIEFGHYYGVFDNDRLVAMTGQRLHVNNYTEISAVCTHPEYLGKGYAYALMQHQLHLIIANGQVPFLHVREDNIRAIDLYVRLGFIVNGGMNFYFMKK